MRDRLIEVLGNFPIWHSTMRERWMPEVVERLADHLLAEGVIVPICKVGDMVYQINPTPYGGEVYELEIFAIDLPYYETELIDFVVSEIGKSIFLTREEAEKALERREK